jgi:hypothetical protein
MSKPILVLTADQKEAILKILNGNGKKKMFFESRAGRLMRAFNNVLGFSGPAHLLYLHLAGFMGIDKKRARDEVQVGADVMARWLGCKERAVQKFIRELTLSGPLPLIDKRVPGGVGKTTLYAFVCDPFELAARQAEAALANCGARNVSTRPAIEIVGNADRSTLPHSRSSSVVCCFLPRPAENWRRSGLARVLRAAEPRVSMRGLR